LNDPALGGAGLASLLNKIGRRRVTVGMDGSLYKFHPHLSNRMFSIARKLVCDCINFDMVTIKSLKISLEKN